MTEQILIEKTDTKQGTCNFKVKGQQGIHCCNEEDWKLYEIKWKMFKNGIDEKDIEELEQRSRDAARRDYDEECY